MVESEQAIISTLLTNFNQVTYYFKKRQNIASQRGSTNNLG